MVLDRLKFIGVDTVLIADLVPCVVHADVNTGTIGFQIDKIRFDTGIQIHDTVAADTAVDKLVFTGAICAQFSLNEQSVAATQPELHIVAIAATIGDGIALKQNSFSHKNIFSISLCVQTLYETHAPPS